MLAKSYLKDSLGLRYYGVAADYAVAARVPGFAGLFPGLVAVNIRASFLTSF